MIEHSVHSPPDAVGIRAIARSFHNRWIQGYARGKLSTDPAFAAVVTEIGAHPAPVLDIGCGIGLLGHYLRATGVDSEYLGIDADARKIAAARAGAGWRLRLDFEHASAEAMPRWRGHVVMLDMLHYLERERQQSLLAQAAGHVGPGGTLFVRNVLRDSTWRFQVTRAEEALLRCSRWIRVPTRHYPSAEDIHGVLAGSGLSVSIAPLWGRTPFNSYMIRGRRPVADPRP